MWSMDKLVTGIIIGWAAASIFGLSRTKKWRKFWERVADNGQQYAKTWVSMFWRFAVQVIKFFEKK